MKMPFYIMGNADNLDGWGNKHIVIIAEVAFTIGAREWGDQAHLKQCHHEDYDADIGVCPMRAVPDEHVYEKHVVGSEEEAVQFMKQWWSEQ